MNIQTEKLSLLQSIMDVSDEGLLMDIKAFLSSRNADWFDEFEQKKYWKV